MHFMALHAIIIIVVVFFAYIGNTLGIFESSSCICGIWRQHGRKDGDKNDIKLKGFFHRLLGEGKLKKLFSHPRKFILGWKKSSPDFLTWLYTCKGWQNKLQIFKLNFPSSDFSRAKNPCPLSNFNLYCDLIFFLSQLQ